MERADVSFLFKVSNPLVIGATAVVGLIACRLHSALAFGVVPDPEIPSQVVDGLLRRNIDVRSRIPQRVTREALASAISYHSVAI
jgi:hypothetical protein